MTLVFYTLKKHVAPFLYSLFIITFIFIMDLLVHILDKIISKGLDPKVVLEIMVLNLAWMIALAVPMAVLIATLMAYGSMSQDNEIVAMKASGMNVTRIIGTTVFFSFVITTSLVLFNNFILPESNHRSAMLSSDISRKRPAAFIKPGYIIDDFKGFVMIVEDIDPITDTMKGLKIIQESDDGPETVTFAEKGKLEYLNDGRIIRLRMFDGESHQTDYSDPSRYYIMKFLEQLVYIRNVDDEFKRSSERKRGDREMDISMMYDEVLENRQAAREAVGKITNIESNTFGTVDTSGKAGEMKSRTRIDPFNAEKIPVTIYAKAASKVRSAARRQASYANVHEARKKQEAKYLVEIHKKISIPVACIIFAMIGAPLGVLARKGGVGIGVSLSIGFFIFYWAFLISGEMLADRLILRPWVAMWAPNLILFFIGVYFLRKVRTEKDFILIDTLISFSEKIKKKLDGRR
ncbi:MAG: LptF/LptG family permease [Fibrobacterota bacterium]